MVIPCDIGIVCPPNPGGNEADSPVTNYSSEGPEQQPIFTSLIFPTSWEKPGCLSLCTSTISQNDADLCALAQAAQCVPVPPGQPPGPIFFSQSTTCNCVSLGGSQFFYTVPAGTFSGPTQAIANALAYAYACEQCSNPGGGPGPGPGGGPGPNPGTSFSLGPLPETLCLGASGPGQIPTSHPVAVLWTVFAGALPTGLSLNLSTGVISGTASGSGSFDFTIRAYNAQGNYAQRSYNICVIAITPDTLPAAVVGEAYSQTLVATACITPSFWQVISGSLPPGLTLNNLTGTISGTPTGTSANYTFTVEMTD